MKNFKLGDKIIGEEYPPYFIADIAANHDGDIKRAYQLIELAKESGADAAKFQNFKAQTIVSKHGFNHLKDKLSHQVGWKKSVFEVYEDASIPDEWSRLLKEKCEEVGIEYMTSPYDFKSVDYADCFVNAFKIGSGDITWIEIIEHMAKKGKPLLLATGASNIEDVNRAMESISRYNVPIVLMQCNTNYTASRENFKFINLNVLRTYKKQFPEAILGLSDHTLGDVAVLGAIALGARVIEKHFTDDNDRIGPDHKFSMTPLKWKEMVDHSYELFNALGDGVKKIEENEKETAVIQRRALYYTRNLSRGHVITPQDIIPVRPINQGEFAPYEIEKIVGKVLKREVIRDYAVKKEDLNA